VIWYSLYELDVRLLSSTSGSTVRNCQGVGLTRTWRQLSGLAVGVLAMLLAVPSAAAAEVDSIVTTGNYDVTCLNSTQASPNFACQTDNATFVERARSRGSLQSPEWLEELLSQVRVRVMRRFPQWQQSTCV
jgi:hypothetical protein